MKLHKTFLCASLYNPPERRSEFTFLFLQELSIIYASSVRAASGPFSSQGKIVTGVDTLVVCGDMVATDLYCADLLAEYDSGFSADFIAPMVARAGELGIGASDLSSVDVREVRM